MSLSNKRLTKTEILRHRAEEELKLKVRSLNTDDEVLKLLQELQVHQIELEIQNNELKLAKEKIEVSAEKYTDLFDFSPIAYFSLSNEGDILDLNLSASLLLGKERLHLKGSRFGLFVSEGSRQVFTDFLETLRTTQTRESCEITLKQLNGNFPLIVNCTGIFDNENGHFLIAAADITESKKVTDSLNRTISLLNASLESTADGILIVNSEGVIVQWNKKFGTMWHLTEELLSSKDDAFVISQIVSQLQDPQQFVEKVNHLYDNPEEYSYDEIKFLDGRIFERYSQPQRLGNTVVGRVWSFRDVTERKNTEESLKKSEAFNKSIIENEPECVKILNPGGIIKYMNPAGLTIIEADSLDVIIGKCIYPLILPQYREAFITLTENVFKGNSGELIFEINGFKGSHRWLHSSVAPLYDREGIVESALSITRDITKLKEGEIKISQQNQELIRANAEKDKFYSILAHDLRSPFNGFLGLTEMITKDLHAMSLDEIQEIALLLNNSANNLYSLLGNLLEWSRLQRGLINTVHESLFLLPNISECLKLIIEDARKKEIQFDLDIPQELAVTTDAKQLESIIRNLATNAVKFTPKRGNVAVSARTNSDNAIEITIKDSGIGMNNQLIENLFRLDVNTGRNGTEGESSSGMGLIICKDLIEKLGGELHVESEVGKGSKFKFTIPFRT